MTLRIDSRGSQEQQNAYRRAIEAVLLNVRRTRTGRIVITYIERSARIVTIVPYTSGGRNAEAVPGSQAASGTFSSERVARGTNSRVRFSVGSSVMPANWPQGSSDEVLVHELSHALRQINGAERYSRNAAGARVLLPIASFENVEEFFAAMVASVHSSELGRAALGNHGQWRLRDPDVLQRPPFSTRLRQIWVRMPQFAADMAAIPANVAAFNPFRDVPH